MTGDADSGVFSTDVMVLMKYNPTACVLTDGVVVTGFLLPLWSQSMMLGPPYSELILSTFRVLLLAGLK